LIGDAALRKRVVTKMIDGDRMDAILRSSFRPHATRCGDSSCAGIDGVHAIAATLRSRARWRSGFVGGVGDGIDRRRPATEPVGSGARRPIGRSILGLAPLA